MIQPLSVRRKSLALLTVGLSGLVITTAATAETSADDAYLLPPVYVSASRLPAENLADGARNVIVLDSEEIARRSPESIADLLSGLPGVDARSRGPFDVQTDLEVNGSTYSQVLVLVDGMRVNDPQTGHHTLNLPLAPEDLERVEITYGQGSAVHGPDAVGAVVNLVPRSNPANRLNLTGHWGNTLGNNTFEDALGVARGGQDASLSYGLRSEWGSIWAAAGKSRSSGYRADTDFDVDRALVSARIPFVKGDLSLLWGVQDKAFGANQFYGNSNSVEWTRNWIYSARYRRPTGSGRSIEGSVAYKRHRDRFVYERGNPAFSENIHTSELVTVQLHATVASGYWGAVVAGSEVAQEKIDSNNLGDRNQSRGAVFSEYRGDLGPWNYNAGVRLDSHEEFGLEGSPSVAVSFRPSSKARYFASAGRSFRAPDFTERFLNCCGNQGNPDLEAENAWTLEAGTQIAPTDAVQIAATVFSRFERHLIDYIGRGDPPVWKAENLGEMRTDGLQLTAAAHWPLVRTQLDYTVVDKEQTLESGVQSKYVFTHGRQQLGLRVDHSLRAGFEAGWLLTMKERIVQEDYMLLDLIIQRRFSYGRSLLRVRNLTDRRYESALFSPDPPLGVPMPGRWFSLETQIDL